MMIKKPTGKNSYRDFYADIKLTKFLKYRVGVVCVLAYKTQTTPFFML